MIYQLSHSLLSYMLLDKAKPKKAPLSWYLLGNALSHPTGFIMIPIPTYTPTVTCPSCSAQIPATFNYCSNCGTHLHIQMVLKICPKCQTRIPERSRFCPECGQKQ